jgi:hypothetical protein
MRVRLPLRITCTELILAVPRYLILIASCDSPAQRQVSGEKGPGAKLGCEKCHQFGWQDPAIAEAKEQRQRTVATSSLVRQICIYVCLRD